MSVLGTIVALFGGVVGAIIGAVVAVWTVKRRELTNGIAVTTKHDQQLKRFEESLKELKQEASRQWAETLKRFERFEERFNKMERQIDRLVLMFEQHQAREADVQRNTVQDSLEAMRRWCREECSVREKIESYSDVTSTPYSRVTSWRGKAFPGSGEDPK